MNVSSVSPDRCEMIAVYPLRRASSMASSVSEIVPIWFTFTRMEFATPSLMPRCSIFVLVTNRSSPTSCTLRPIFSVNRRQPVQSFSSRPSSSDTIGYWRVQLSQ